MALIRSFLLLFISFYLNNGSLGLGFFWNGVNEGTKDMPLWVIDISCPFQSRRKTNIPVFRVHQYDPILTVLTVPDNNIRTILWLSAVGLVFLLLLGLVARYHYSIDLSQVREGLI